MPDVLMQCTQTYVNGLEEIDEGTQGLIILSGIGPFGPFVRVKVKETNVKYNILLPHMRKYWRTSLVGGNP